jgi:uncharacterized protein (DUF924 family)
MIEFQEIIRFWFEELNPKDWFKKDASLDENIRSRFATTLEQARRCELFAWRASALGRLAEIIVLDQFSRNIYRDQAATFWGDPLALALAQVATSLKKDQEIDISQRSFFYMPFMHSESRLIHQEAVHLFSQTGLESNLKFEFLHKNIIDRFGRFPHRNQVCKRVSTSEEIEFLREAGSSF